MAAVVLLVAAGCAPSGSGGATAPVACADLTTLRDLGPRLTLVENQRTGNTLEYVVVGDGADTDEILVLFNGTGGVLADWPTQMITNAAASPGIVGTDAYDPGENAPVALCRGRRLLLFDYAGVGDGTAAIEQTFDSIASDVAALLDDAETRYRVPTRDVSVLGWSLGTHAALKFTFLSAASTSERRIHDVILIATRPGGATDGLATGNQAQCVSEPLDVLEQSSLDQDFRVELESDAFRLTFPYDRQPPYDGANSGCTASVDTSSGSVSFDVRLAECLPEGQCGKTYDEQVANRLTAPWRTTKGVPLDVYVNQREFDHDWNVCWCTGAGSDFTSRDCSCSEPIDLSSSNGGVCQCHIAPGEPQAPLCSSCVDLRNSGRITVINGYEDLFIQWTYGRELVRAYNAQYGEGTAAIVTYPGAGGAGHGVHLQHPRWTQEQIAASLGARTAGR